jgi:hypothetical protein
VAWADASKIQIPLNNVLYRSAGRLVIGMKGKLKKRAIRWLALPCALALSVQQIAADSAPLMTPQPGLLAANFTTSKGWIQVNFPFDISGGDTVSGTILMEPKATSAREQASAEKDMGAYTVLIDTVEAKVSEGEFTIKVPKDASTLSVQLKNKSGQVLGTESIKVAKLEKEYKNFFVPGVSQSGETLQVWGAFDGIFGNTQARANGQRLDKLAESPRQVILALPPATTGKINFTLSEQNTEVSGSCPVLNVEMKQSNSYVSKGKLTEVAITVTGVAGLEKAVDLVIQNFSPENAELVGGNPLKVSVEPSASNVFQYSCNVKGLKPGTLTLSAILSSKDYLPTNSNAVGRSSPTLVGSPASVPVSVPVSVSALDTVAVTTEDPIALICGTWKSAFGPVTFSKAGPVVGDALAVNGSWDQAPDKKGVIQNGLYNGTSRTLEFDYCQKWDNTTGKGKFSLSKDGKILTGKWIQGSSEGLWELNR